MEKFKKSESEGSNDKPPETITISKAELEDLQLKTKKYAKEQTPDKPAPKSVGKSSSGTAKPLFPLEDTGTPEGDTDSKTSNAQTLANVLKDKLVTANGNKDLQRGEYSVTKTQRSVAEKLARKVARHFDDDEYPLLDAVRQEVKLASGAKKINTLLEAMFKALIILLNRRI